MVLDDAFIVRLAQEDDIPSINELTEASIQALEIEGRTYRKIRNAVWKFFGIGISLFDNRTSFVAERLDDIGKSEIVGFAGWSKSQTSNSRHHRQDEDEEQLNPMFQGARIHTLIVDPDWVRRGIGSRLLSFCEEAAVFAGCRQFELVSTFLDVSFFSANGYKATKIVELPTDEG